jgi:hypothetical protein
MDHREPGLRLPALPVSGTTPPRPSSLWRRLAPPVPLALGLFVLGVGLAASLWLSLPEQNLNVYRAKYSIRLSLVLAGPAFCLYALGLGTGGRWGAWRWWWTFGLIAYLVHFFYSMRAFHYSAADVYLKQGFVVASSNFVVTGLWALDVCLAWLAPRPGGRPARAERLVTTVLVFVSFFVASVLFKTGLVHYLGLAVTVATAGFLLYRILDARWGRESPPPAAETLPPG